jgi:hypothetical protein
VVRIEDKGWYQYSKVTFFDSTRQDRAKWWLQHNNIKKGDTLNVLPQWEWPEEIVLYPIHKTAIKDEKGKLLAYNVTYEDTLNGLMMTIKPFKVEDTLAGFRKYPYLPYCKDSDGFKACYEWINK